MPDEIIQHGQLDGRGGRRQVAQRMSAVRKNEERGGLQRKPNHPNQIEPDEVNH